MRVKCVLSFLLVSFLLIITAPVCSVAEGHKGDPEAGKKIYERYCRYCHGRTGRGDGAISMAVYPHPADFVGDRKRMAKSDEELFKSISDGVKRPIGGEAMRMPPWKGILSEKERWDVLSYIRLLEKRGLEEEQKKTEGER